MATKTNKASTGASNPDAGDPKRMLVRMTTRPAPGSSPRSRSYSRRGRGPDVELVEGQFYDVVDEQILQRVLETRVDFRSRGPKESEPRYNDKNPLLFTRVSQRDAIAEELTEKPEGSFPSRLVGSAFNPRRILAVPELVRAEGDALVHARAALEAAEAVVTAARAVVDALEGR